MRQQALLHADHEHHGKFEALGRMERDQRHPIRRLIQLVLVADERNFLQETSEALGCGDLVELGGVVAQLRDVRPALLTVVGPVLDDGLEARALEGGVEDGRRRLGRHHRHQPAHEIGEDAELGARPRSKVRVLAGCLHGIPEADVARLGPGIQLLDRLRADPARRHVDDPSKRHAVGGVASQPDVPERVLHLAPLIEAGPTDKLVRDPEPHQRFLEHATLGVDPVGNRDVAIAQ